MTTKRKAFLYISYAALIAVSGKILAVGTVLCYVLSVTLATRFAVLFRAAGLIGTFVDEKEEDEEKSR